MNDLNCPTCGASLGPRFGVLKMISCAHCGTTSYLEDDQFRAAGQSGVMHDGPQLLALDRPVRIAGRLYTPRGQARFSYGRGEWDEFWAHDPQGEGAWISVDEGDVVVQVALAPGNAPRPKGPLVMGQALSARGESFAVSEIEDATCIALRGVFPEVLRLGERYRFVNATAPSGRLLSGEEGPDGWDWFVGDWVDPFEVVTP